MENGSEALMMTFAVLVLIIALSVAMISFSNAKSAADSILYTKDETNYYEYIGAKGKAQENRIVGLETIIPTLYKYYKENYTVVFKQANYNEIDGTFSNEDFLKVYDTSPTLSANWQASYKNLMSRKYGISNPTTKIFSFDLDEETLRHEPWTGSYDKIHNNLDCFLRGSKYYNPNNNSLYINYGNYGSGFVNKYRSKKFIETIQEYKYEAKDVNNGYNYQTNINSSSSKAKSKRMIIFTLKLN